MKGGPALGLLLLCFASAAGANRPAFTRKPTVAKQGAGAVVTFAVSKLTDVEVAILDARGKVVRHLAAGMLGPNAPDGLKAGSLTQSVRWDGKDDLGNAAKAGPFKARVSLGMRPAFAGLIGAEPIETINSIRGLTVDQAGNLYVFHVYGSQHMSDGTASVIQLDRDGRYVRTVLPFPADLPEAKLKGLKRIEDEKGNKLPFFYQLETRNLIPGAGDLFAQRPAITRDGRILFAGIHEYGRSTMYPASQLVMIRSDGSIPENPLGPILMGRKPKSPHPENRGHGGHRTGSVALSPSEKTVYVTEVTTGGFGGKPTHVVYKCAWGDRFAKAFIGEFRKPGQDAKHLSDPRGICTDKDGNIYVADHGNGRVAVFKPNGALLGEVRFDRPHRVEVAPDGSVYVLGGKPHCTVLAKLKSWKDAKPVATLPLPMPRNKNNVGSLAVDTSRQPRVIWVGTSWHSPYTLLRIEERNGAFGKPKSILGKSKKAPRSAGVVMDLALRKQGNTLVVRDVPYGWQEKYHVVRDATQNSTLTPSSDLRRHTRYGGSFGLDGKLYIMEFSRTILRFDEKLRPVKFPDSKDGKKERGGLVVGFGSTFRGRGRGVTADPHGNIFLLVQKAAQFSKEFLAGEPTALFKFGPDGSQPKRPVIDAEFRGVASPRVDYKGNIYMMAGLRPGKALLPNGLKGVPASRKDPDATFGLNAYPLIYGSILKFGPDGGALRLGKGDGIACNLGFGLAANVTGAKWIAPGASNVPSWRIAGTPDICLCESTRFDVDGYGRSFYPDAGRFRVGVLDTNGNHLGSFGSYGNQDSAGPQSRIPTPAIPLWWPQSVCVTDGYVFIGDRLNCRVVRVRLDYAATETVALPR